MENINLLKFYLEEISFWKNNYFRWKKIKRIFETVEKYGFYVFLEKDKKKIKVFLFLNEICYRSYQKNSFEVEKLLKYWSYSKKKNILNNLINQVLENEESDYFFQV